MTTDHLDINIMVIGDLNKSNFSEVGVMENWVEGS